MRSLVRVAVSWLPRNAFAFTAQVAKGIPTAVTIASKDDEVASRVQDLLSTHRFRCYRTTDVQGALLAATVIVTAQPLSMLQVASS